MMDGMGFGRPLDFAPMLSTPGFIEMAWSAPIRRWPRGWGQKSKKYVGRSTVG